MEEGSSDEEKMRNQRHHFGYSAEQCQVLFYVNVPAHKYGNPPGVFPLFIKWQARAVCVGEPACWICTNFKGEEVYVEIRFRGGGL